MTPDQENALLVIYERAAPTPESAWIDADDVTYETLNALIASGHVRQNATGRVKLTPTGLVVARRPRGKDALPGAHSSGGNQP